MLAQSSCSSSAPRFSCIPAASIPSVTYWRYLLRGAGHGFLTHPSIQIPIRGRDGFSEPNLTDGETLAPTFTTFLFGVKLATILVRVRGRGPLLWTAFTRLPFKDSYLFFRTKWSDRTQVFVPELCSPRVKATRISLLSSKESLRAENLEEKYCTKHSSGVFSYLRTVTPPRSRLSDARLAQSFFFQWQL